MMRCVRIASLVVALTVFSLSFTACGSSGGDKVEASSSSAPQSSIYKPHTKSEKQAYRAVAAFAGAFRTSTSDHGTALSTATSACASMSAAMQRHMIIAAKATAGPKGDWSCKAAMAYLIGHSGGGTTRPSRIIRLKVTGNTASATARNAEGEISHMHLSREGGQWKVGAPGG